jgi:hypothetical protein
VIYSGDSDDPQDHQRLLEVLAIGLANLATNNAILSGGAATVVLNPDHAAILARANMSRDAVAERLHALTAHSSADLARVAGGFAKGKSEPQTPRHSFRSADDILILMAGGSGLYSMVMPSWCAGPHQNSAVSVQVEVDQFCEVPGSS